MTGQSFGRKRSAPLGILAVLAFISAIAYLDVALSGQSLHEGGRAHHSLLTILALFALAFGCYLVAIRVAVRARQEGPFLGLIVLGASSFASRSCSPIRSKRSTSIATYGTVRSQKAA
ncbi:MAG: hypothetical protein JWN86_528 [Planctomycetota bacterium]|nr:hypothetical protein [Planctomycetota bacterium]